MTARDLNAEPDYTDLIHALTQLPVTRDFFGLELDSIGPGAVQVAITHRPELGHMPGWFQGGVVSALAEFAAGASAATLAAPGWNSMTLSQSITFVAPARGERLIARGRVLKGGRTSSSAAADVFVLRDGEEHLCAAMLQTNSHAPPKGR